MTEKTKKITACQFGKIVIDNRTYTSDVIIFGEKVTDGWWRKKGHVLDAGDFKDVSLKSADHIIVGTGYYGMMKVSPSFEAFCRTNNILLESIRTPEAVDRFNMCSQEKNLIGAFHLSC